MSADDNTGTADDTKPAGAARWRATKPYVDQGIWYIDDALEPESFGFIATVSDVTGQGEKHAHWIAAAPELYAALRAAETRVRDDDALWPQVARALAKAEGRQR